MAKWLQPRDQRPEETGGGERGRNKRLGSIFFTAPEEPTVLTDIKNYRRIPGSFFSSSGKDKDLLQPSA